MAGLLEGCAECDFGWRYATEEYIAERFPIPPHATAEQIEAAYRKRESYREFVLPCAACRPDAFRRWANGCWAPEHKASRCELCLEALGVKAASSHDRKAFTPSGGEGR